MKVAFFALVIAGLFYVSWLSHREVEVEASLHIVDCAFDTGTITYGIYIPNNADPEKYGRSFCETIAKEER